MDRESGVGQKEKQWGLMRLDLVVGRKLRVSFLWI